MAARTQPQPATSTLSSQTELEQYLANLSALQRQRHRVQAEADEKIAPILAQAAADIADLDSHIDQITSAIRTYALEHQAELAPGHAKTASLATGTIAWQTGRPSIKVTNSRRAIKVLQQLGLTRFIRIKYEVNKQALGQEPEVAHTIPGIAVKPGGPVLTINPTGGVRVSLPIRMPSRHPKAAI